ncbi:hypothetical protein PMI07_000812 [Rhizobium sp. CF080]|uniref:hypothetical protein n=1 Tax=Rhizobium sp. (strain CF080) TaxID=1144310 RepID=UPI000271D612|nr:hypothetical protein [Rhizobium sp. CF080]EUB97236.1 hypothetical protein PMI07_000812 [Rhizobium sp. CF080]
MKSQTEELTLFRVHYDGGGHIDIEAKDPNEARDIFKQRYPRIIIDKVKRLKGGAA